MIYVCCQILETIPISDEVSDLLQKLGNFYDEVEGAEAEENEVDKRAFTRPFANHAGTVHNQKLKAHQRKNTTQSIESSAAQVGCNTAVNSLREITFFHRLSLSYVSFYH